MIYFIKLCALWDCTGPLLALKPSWVLLSLYIVLYSSLRFMLTDDFSSIILVNTRVTNPKSTQRSIRIFMGVGRWVKKKSSAWRTWICILDSISYRCCHCWPRYKIPESEGGKGRGFYLFIYLFMGCLRNKAICHCNHYVLKKSLCTMFNCCKNRLHLYSFRMDKWQYKRNIILLCTKECNCAHAQKKMFLIKNICINIWRTIFN